MRTGKESAGPGLFAGGGESRAGAVCGHTTELTSPLHSAQDRSQDPFYSGSRRGGCHRLLSAHGLHPAAAAE